MRPPIQPPGLRGKRRQLGYLMAGLMAAIAVMGIFSTLAFQEWSEMIRRDNEVEMMFRARDISRAIVRYRRDHGGQSPTNLDQLLEPGPRGQYYLRQLWKDPLMPDGKWGLLYVGPGGQIIDPNNQQQGGAGLDGGLGGGLGGALNPPGGGIGQPATGGVGQPEAGGLNPAGGAFGNQPGGQGAGSTGSLLNPDDGSGGSGLPIAGVRTLSEDDPYRVLNGLTQYSQWLFTYQEYEGNPGGAGKKPGSKAGGLGGVNQDRPFSKGVGGSQ